MNKYEEIINLIPEGQRPAAAALMADFGPALLAMAQEDLWAILKRLVEGDYEIFAELNSQLSNDEFIAKVKANTAKWQDVANYNKVRASIKNEFILRAAPILFNIIAVMVGL